MPTLRTMRKNHLGKYLQKKRIKSDLTQIEVAKKLGYSSAQFISNFERGLCSPPLKQMKKLTSLYELDPAEVIDIMMKERLEILEKAFYGKRKKALKA